MILVCLRCGVDYWTEDKRRKFCGVDCYRAKSSEAPGAGAFRAGQRPWNAGLRGVHLSPGTEFKKGQRAHNAVPLGTVRIRQHGGDTPRAWVKTGLPNRWEPQAILAFLAAGGVLRPGQIVHHRDHNSLNDDPRNLQALTRAEHQRAHRLRVVGLDALGAK